jgi:hypothetical protein
MPLDPLEIPIVLTGTIVPNVTGAAAADPLARLEEYRNSIRFYQQHAPVIFLENSSFALERDPEFRDSERLRVHRFPPSAFPERGKGFQEFEMIDRWLDSKAHSIPEQWIKITGRYKFQNIDSILNECRHEQARSLIVDQSPRAGFARTYAFWVRTSFYRQWMAGLYRQCDDSSGAFIERVLFKQLKGVPKRDVRFFLTQPRLIAVAGSTGQAFPSGRAQWMLKQCLRTLNRFIDPRYLRYAK